MKEIIFVLGFVAVGFSQIEIGVIIRVIIQLSIWTLMEILILMCRDILKHIMKTKVLFFLLIIFVLMSSCSSTNILYEKKKRIEMKLNIALETCSKRSKENSKQFEQVLRDDDNVNEFSNTLIKTLLDNEYVEIDFNDVFNIEIEKVLLLELFHKEADIYLGNTMPKIFEINGIDYFLFYMDDGDKYYPNLYTVVYVDDFERKKIRVFYKVNFELEYQAVQINDVVYKVFY